MTTKERSVEEIAEEVYLKIVTRAGIPVEHIAEALKTERQKREQELQKARQSERTKLTGIAVKLKDVQKTFGFPIGYTHGLEDFISEVKALDQSELDQPK